jgi:hypothetical protein
MKKRLFLVLACLASAAQAFAEVCYSDCNNCFGFDSVLSFDIGGGYRQDRFQWKTFPVASETRIKEEWKNVNMGIVETNVQFLACEHYLFKFDFDYGWFDRQRHQSIRGFDFITASEFANLNSKIRGQAYDLSGAIGYQFNWDCYRIALAPLVGWSYYHQRFKNPSYSGFLNGVTGDFLDIRNRYRYSWNGPWLGFAVAYQVCCELQYYIDYAFHWSELNGRFRDFFLAGRPLAADDYSSRIRSNRAYGNEVTVGATYQFCPDWFLGLKFNYKDFWTDKGHISTSIDDLTERSPLRRAQWQSWFVTVDIGYTF